MRTRMKAVCWRAVTAVALVSGMMMTGCALIPDREVLATQPFPIDSYAQRADYTNTLAVVAATVGDYTYTYVVTNGGAMLIGPSQTFKLRDEHPVTRYQRAVSPEPTSILSVPATLDGYPVMSIGEWAFGEFFKLKRVIIPPGVTSIGDYAFVTCFSLTSVEIPPSVTSIGDYAFMGCFSLTSVEIPPSVTSIGRRTFWDCGKLKSVGIPSGVTSIGEWAFAGCTSLKSVTIPSSVTSIERYAFEIVLV